MSENTPGGAPRDPADPDEPGTTPTPPEEPDPFAPPAPEPPASPGTPEPPAYEPPAYEPPAVPATPATPPVEPTQPPPTTPPVEPTTPPAEPTTPPAQPTTPPAEPPVYGQPAAPAEPPAYGSPGTSGEPPAPTSPYGPPPGATPYPAAPPAYSGPTGAYGAYGTPPPTTPTFTVGEAVGFAWNRFKGNALPWVLFVVVLLVINAVFNSSSIADYQRTMDAALEGRPFAQAGMTFTATLLSIIGSLLSAVVQALAVRAALREVSGDKPTLASFFTAERMGTVVVAAVIVGVLTYIGLFACILPGLAIIVFASFTYHNVHDKGLGAWEAFTASFRLVSQNFGPVFLLLLACLGLVILGAIPCGLGTFITLPIVTIAIAYAFRRLTGGPIAPVTA